MGDRELLDKLGQDIQTNGGLGMGKETDRDQARKDAATGVRDSVAAGNTVTQDVIALGTQIHDRLLASATAVYQAGQLDKDHNGVADDPTKANDLKLAKDKADAEQKTLEFFNKELPIMEDNWKARSEALRNPNKNNGMMPFGQNGFDASGFPTGMTPMDGHMFVAGPNGGAPMQLPTELAEAVNVDRDNIKLSENQQKLVNDSNTRIQAITTQLTALDAQIRNESDNKKRDDLAKQANALRKELKDNRENIESITKTEARMDENLFKNDIKDANDWREFYQKWSVDQEKYNRKVSDDIRKWELKEQGKNNDAQRRIDSAWQKAQINNWSKDQQFGRQQEGKFNAAYIKDGFVPQMQRENFMADGILGWGMTQLFGERAAAFLPSRLFGQFMKYNKQSNSGRNTNYQPYQIGTLGSPKK